jgi:hypothetical protein
MLASPPRPTAKTPRRTVCRRVLASTIAYQEDRDKKLAVSRAAMDRSKEKASHHASTLQFGHHRQYWIFAMELDKPVTHVSTTFWDFSKTLFNLRCHN